jgi:hypothetical protein
LVNDLQIAKVVVSSFKGGVSREEEEEEEAKFPFPPLLPKLQHLSSPIFT